VSKVDDDIVQRRRRQARRWLSVAVATAVMVVSYAVIVFGLAVAGDDETAFGGGLVGIGFGLVPGVFLALAALSDHERPFRATGLAVVLFFLVGLPIAFVDIPTGLVAGFGAGGVVSLRRDAIHLLSFRVAAVAILTAYTFLVQLVVPAAALLVGAVAPLVVVALADVASEREAKMPGGEGDSGPATPSQRRP